MVSQRKFLPHTYCMVEHVPNLHLSEASAFEIGTSGSLRTTKNLGTWRQPQRGSQHVVGACHRAGKPCRPPLFPSLLLSIIHRQLHP